MIRTAWFFFKLFLGLFFLESQRGRVEKIKETQGEEAYRYEVKTIAKNWCFQRLKEAGATVYVHGMEKVPDRNVLFVSNHLSNIDFAVIFSEMDRYMSFVAKKELEKIPFINKWMFMLNCLMMDRSDMKSQLKNILKGIEMLKAGETVVIFPEGTRSRDGKMLDFKAGSFKLATKSGVPIVPLTITGTGDILENNGYRLKPGDVHLYVHDPIYMEDLDKEQKANLHVTVQDIIAKTYYENI